MKALGARSALVVLAAAGVLSACSFPRRGPSPIPASSPLPEIAVYEIVARADSAAPFIQAVRSRGGDPLAGIASTRRVTLASNNADARTLLLWLAQQAEVSLVVSPDVRARVSVNFSDILVADAIRAVIAEARLSLLVGDELSPWPPVVFYQLPVNVNTASAETIAARFGVSLELAKWMVESRHKP